MDKAQRLNPVGVRIPDRLRDELKKAAAIAGRSLNAEILHRLEGSFEEKTTERRLKSIEAALRKQGLMK